MTFITTLGIIIAALTYIAVSFRIGLWVSDSFDSPFVAWVVICTLVFGVPIAAVAQFQ